jgi:antitoxin component of MazEF toxin-antitoxin module
MNMLTIDKEDNSHRVAIPYESVEYIEFTEGKFIVRTKQDEFVFDDQNGNLFDDALDLLKQPKEKVRCY